ncbi:glycosyltransferase family 2 protein [Candidatus Poribacteria bacterium]|nr:glycosyltransferase family 2 protein [Candidatus Poribacteria bacterium]
MREPLTILIPAYNEEGNIRECLDSVKWADEIFVVDSFSTDRTLEICREYTDRIAQHEYVNSAAQKNWAIPQATHKWVMIVDSDERVSERLRQSICRVLENPKDFDGFFVQRQSFFLGKPIMHGGWEKDYVLRLFNKERGRYQDRQVHACIEVEGKRGYLDGPLYHYTYRNLDQYFEKFLRYTKWAAGDLKSGERSPSWTNLSIRPCMRFLKMYVMRLGFLDGKHGLVLSMLAAFSVFTKYARLWEMSVREAPRKVGEPERQGPTAAAARPESVRGKS